MQIHEMRLSSPYFEEIAKGRKKIEIRLNDEKRSKIKIGDTIKFLSRSENGRSILATVRNLKLFPNFQALFDYYELSLFGNVWKSRDEALSAMTFYSPPQIKKYGVLAIEVSLK